VIGRASSARRVRPCRASAFACCERLAGQPSDDRDGRSARASVRGKSAIAIAEVSGRLLTRCSGYCRSSRASASSTSDPHYRLPRSGSAARGRSETLPVREFVAGVTWFARPRGGGLRMRFVVVLGRLAFRRSSSRKGRCVSATAMPHPTPRRHKCDPRLRFGPPRAARGRARPRAASGRFGSRCGCRPEPRRTRARGRRRPR
jgi:hypothetical protein